MPIFGGPSEFLTLHLDQTTIHTGETALLTGTYSGDSIGGPALSEADRPHLYDVTGDIDWGDGVHTTGHSPDFGYFWSGVGGAVWPVAIPASGSGHGYSDPGTYTITVHFTAAAVHDSVGNVYAAPDLTATIAVTVLPNNYPLALAAGPQRSGYSFN